MSGFEKAKIADKQHWAPGLATITVEYPTPDFIAGQFMQIAAEVDGEQIKRSYSISSAPGKPLEFFISEVAGGALSPILCQKEIGDELLIDGNPLGFFTLQEVPPARFLWLASTGTGLGPTISMLRQEEDLDRFEEVLIIHGVRQQSDLAYRQELEELMTSGANQGKTKIRYIPVVSREGAPEIGLQGRITERFADGSLEKIAAQTMDADSHLLLCGNPAMITDMATLMKERGFEKHRRRKSGHFNFEKYW
ncbi:MAG: ferredoxin--NADP reductase [Polyangiaceae bacterium]|nr:ferredoxin--NADP reductase [Polyangiaceae bacterium]